MQRDIDLPLNTPRVAQRPRRLSVPTGTVVRHAIIIVFCLVAMVPVIWVFSMSLKSVREAYITPINPPVVTITLFAK